MKKTVILFFFAAIALTGSVWSQTNFAAAEVEQVQGLLVFVKAKPVAKYKYLGTVKGPTFSKGDFDVMLPKMIAKVKEEFPKANGILFNGEMGPSETYKVDAILFE